VVILLVVEVDQTTLHLKVDYMVAVEEVMVAVVLEHQMEPLVQLFPHHHLIIHH
jgi:hypothetical protein